MTSLLMLKSMLFASALQRNKKKKRLQLKKSNNRKVLSLKMCRICNAERGKIPIFSNAEQPNMAEEITNFSGVTINKEENLSNNICLKCLNLLNGCRKFRDMCLRSSKMMIELSIKEERNNLEETRAVPHDSDESYNIPSPTFSEDNTGIWSCTTCNREFYDMPSYNNHLSECHAVLDDTAKANEEGTKRTFLCDICGKTARSNANLLVHMAIHENIFPFKCDECPYQGRTMDLLKVHKRTHMADKPFKCTQCPKSTTTSSNLAKHMRHVHSTTRPYKCTYCDKAFSYQHDMKRHIKDIHLRQGTVECDVCFKKFNTKKILQGHRWKIHQIKGERHGRLPAYLQCRQVEEQNEKMQEYAVIY